MSTATLTLTDVLVEIAEALEPVRDEIPGLQITPYLNSNPTPPSLDIYPGEPFLSRVAMGVAGAVQAWFTIRCRVSTADQQAGQQLLLRMLDPRDRASVEWAIFDSASVVPEGVSGFREYVEDTASNGRLLGCEWRVTRYLN